MWRPCASRLPPRSRPTGAPTLLQAAVAKARASEAAVLAGSNSTLAVNVALFKRLPQECGGGADRRGLGHSGLLVR